jgi:hypothetical protein
MAGVPTSHVHGGPLLRPFQASANTIKNTAEERRSIAAQHAASNRMTQLHPASSNSGGTSSDVTFQDAKEGSKKRHKQHRQEIATDDKNGINR